MKKNITYGIIATGLLTFVGVSEESKAFLKIGVSTAMTQRMGSCYGADVKTNLINTVTILESWISSLKNMVGKLKEINGKYYEFVNQNMLGRIDASLKDLNSLRDRLVLIRDNKRAQLVKGNLVAVNLDEAYEAFKTVLTEGEEVLAAMKEPDSTPQAELRTPSMAQVPTGGSWGSRADFDRQDFGDEPEDTEASEIGGTTHQINTLKIRDKNVKKAEEAYEEAQKRVKATREKFCSVIQQFTDDVEKMANFQSIPILKLREASERDATVDEVEKIMRTLRELNRKKDAFCSEIRGHYDK
jgi:hypothetical protein